MSIYKGSLSTKFVIQGAVKLNKAFPQLPKEFFDVLSDRIKANGFNDERLSAAINHVIDTCVYPVPTIAQFISFDKHVKLYSYDDVVKLNNELKGAFNRYKPVVIEGYNKPVWASINDISKFNLKTLNQIENK